MKKTDVLESLINSLNNESDLENFLNKNKLDSISFVEYFDNLCKYKGIKKSALVNDSNISRSYCYEILRGDKIPDRNNVLKLCFAANLNIDESNRLLKLTNNGLLYPQITRDSIIMFCLKKTYTLMQVDSILYDKNLDTLITE